MVEMKVRHHQLLLFSVGLCWYHLTLLGVCWDVADAKRRGNETSTAASFRTILKLPNGAGGGPSPGGWTINSTTTIPPERPPLLHPHDAVAFDSKRSMLSQELETKRPTPLQKMREYEAEWRDDYAARRSSVERALRRSRRRVRRRVLKDVLRQRVGWDRVRHSVRDYCGLLVGGWVVFRGDTHPVLAVDQGGAVLALQTAVLTWQGLDEANHRVVLPTTSPLEPWFYDAAAIAVGGLVWKHFLPRLLRTEKALLPVRTMALPTFFLSVSLFQCWDLVLDAWNNQHADREEDAPFASVVVAVALTLVGLQVGKIPVSLAASSLSGALLVYDSVRAEIAGNWVYMSKHLYQLLHPVICLGRDLLKVVLRWLWRRKNVILPFLRKFRRGRSILKRLRQCKDAVDKPFNDARTYVQNHPVTRALNDFLRKLYIAGRPVRWPLGLAIWGVAVQMNRVTNLGGVWKVFRFTLDPISFVLKRIKDSVRIKDRSRKALVALVRSSAAWVAASAATGAATRRRTHTEKDGGSPTTRIKR